MRLEVILLIIVPETTLRYFLLNYDARCRERPELSGEMGALTFWTIHHNILEKGERVLREVSVATQGEMADSLGEESSRCDPYYDC
jgi:hypothetical protein